MKYEQEIKSALSVKQLFLFIMFIRRYYLLGTFYTPSTRIVSEQILFSIFYFFLLLYVHTSCTPSTRQTIPF